MTSESFRVVVNGGQHTAIVRRDGSFQVPDVAAGAAYLVDVQSTSFMFEPVPPRCPSFACHSPARQLEPPPNPCREAATERTVRCDGGVASIPEPTLRRDDLFLRGTYRSG